MHGLEANLATEISQRHEAYNLVKTAIRKLVDAHQLWLDCAQRFVNAEMSGPVSNCEDDDLASAVSRMGVHTTLARADYEHALKRCREATKLIETTHGVETAMLYKRLIDVLDPPVGWLYVADERTAIEPNFHT